MELVVGSQVIVALVQALLGSISHNFRAVLIDFSNGVGVRFFLVQDIVEDVDEIDHVITEFDALVMDISALPIKYSISVGSGKIDFSGDDVISVYIRRE